MKLIDIFQPALLVSETFHPIISDEYRILDTVRRVLESGFYKRIEIGTLKSVEARRRLSDLRQMGIKITQWLTGDLISEGLNPSTTDCAVRKKTIERMKVLVDVAAESGADRVAFISCQDPGETLRDEARKGLAEVMCATLERMAEYPGMKLLLEPLDRGAHKNNLIGPTDEAVALIREIRRNYANCGISWDSAHVALNREDLCQSLTQSAPYVCHIHLSNAVLDPDSPRYGDWHMPMGKPGFMDAEVASDLLQRTAALFDSDQEVGVSVESRSEPGEDLMENEQKNRVFMSRILMGEVG